MSRVLRSNYVEIRKPHNCEGCGRKFDPPLRMLCISYIDSKRAYSSYICKTCESILDKAGDCDFTFGCLLQEALEREAENESHNVKR